MRYRWTRIEQIFARRRSIGAPGRDEWPRGTRRSRTCRRYRVAWYRRVPYLENGWMSMPCVRASRALVSGGKQHAKMAVPNVNDSADCSLSVRLCLPLSFSTYCVSLFLSFSHFFLSLSLSQRQRPRRSTPLPFGARCRSRFYLSHSPSLALALALYPPRFVVDASSPKKKCVLFAYATRGLTLQFHCSLCAS